MIAAAPERHWERHAIAVQSASIFQSGLLLSEIYSGSKAAIRFGTEFSPLSEKGSANKEG
jgi:hypothetical protein